MKVVHSGFLDLCLKYLAGSLFIFVVMSICQSFYWPMDTGSIPGSIHWKILTYKDITVLWKDN